MPLMEWNETMSVGVAELDDQHKTLIELINEAYDAMQAHDEAKAKGLIVKMGEYAAEHFAAEEGYLKDCNYPKLEAHKFLHVKFANEVEKFQKQPFGGANLSQIFVFLSRWLTNHIMQEDMQYASFMPKNG